MNKTVQPAQSGAQAEPMSVKVQGYWGTIVRRKWVVVASVLAGILIGVALCVVLPKSYRSSTQILIENQKIPDEYVKGIAGGNIDERLMMIQQQVMSRSLLSQILEEYQLYEGLIQHDGLDSAIEKLRKAIKVDTVGTVGSSGPKKKTVDAVTISFSHEEPMTAMKVTAKLASLYIEENLKDREQRVTGVSTFLEQELEDAKKLLEAQEQAISQYKTKYVGVLPEQMETNLRALDRLQMELNTTNDLLYSRTDKVSSLDRSISEYQASLAAGGEITDDSRLTRKDVNPLVARLRQLEQKLTTLRAEWKETYPDISDTKQEIQSVKEQLGDKYGASFADQDNVVKPESQGLVRKDTSSDLYLREIKTQRNDLLTELSSLKNRRDRLLQLIKETERRVEQIPSREQELMILVRDYENMKKNYQALLDKRLNAHVAVNLEKRQKGEQFRILDPANLPGKPESPNQLLIMAASFLGGCGVGIAFVFGLDHVNPTFRRREEIECLPGVRVVATVPWFVTVPDPSRTTSELGRSDGLIENGSQARLLGVRPVIHRGLVAKWQPESIAAEQYRMAATRMVLATEGRRSTVIEITSALESEGKTTTVVNLGYTIARDLGRQTLLLDCDFRRPALHHYVGRLARAGVLDLLDGGASVEECLSAIDEVPCSIMTIGRSGRESNELARIEQLKEILPQLRQQFQYLIVNTPPVLASATMGILASLADEVMMVVKAGSSPQHVVQKAFAMLSLAGEKHVVLNGVDEHSLPHYLYGYNMPYSADPVEETVSR